MILHQLFNEIGRHLPRGRERAKRFTKGGSLFELVLVILTYLCRRRDVETIGKKGIKRSRSASANQSTSKRLRSGTSNLDSPRYFLRSLQTMTPKKSRDGSISSNSTARSKGRKRSNRTELSSSSQAHGASSSCVPTSINSQDCSDERMDESSEEEDVDGGHQLGEEHSNQESNANFEGEAGTEEENELLEEGNEEDDIDEDEMIDEDEDDNLDSELNDHYGSTFSGFGGHIRAMAGYMSGLSGRFRSLLTSIRNKKDPTSQLIALQELSEILSISSEDTLVGSFPTDTFVAELVYILGGPKPSSSNGSNSKSKDTSLAKLQYEDDFAFASGFEENSETMLLACRCLANLMEVMPYAARSVVSHDGVCVLNSKLVEIHFIDLAEQVLQTLEKISREYPSAIVNEGGLSAMLQYLDFFNIHVQRTAMTAAANCCKKLNSGVLDKVKDVMPIIQNVLSYSDHRLVESACRCIVRIVDSYRQSPGILEQLLSNDMIAAVNAILLPSSQSVELVSKASISSSVYTDLLQSLGLAARVSPLVAVTLLENNIVETLYHLLTGSPAPCAGAANGSGSAGGKAEGPQQDLHNTGAAVAVLGQDGSENVAMADVAVLQNLAQRPKEQVQEALSLVAELLPPLSKSGIFDPKQYTERAYNRRKSQKTDASRPLNVPQTNKGIGSDVEAMQQDDSRMASGSPTKVSSRTERENTRADAQARRINTLRHKQGLVKRFTQLVLPTLVEVYSASVALHVRTVALYAILKIVNFVEPKPLNEVLDNVPLASFVAAILSSRDHPILVGGALQLVELLTNRLPNVYNTLLRREGVLWEIEDIASQQVSSHSKDNTKEKDKEPNEDSKDSNMEVNILKEALPKPHASRLLSTSSMSGVSGDSYKVGTMLGFNGHSMTQAEAQDCNVWRARALFDDLSPEASIAGAEGATEAHDALKQIKNLVSTLEEDAEKSIDIARSTLMSIANLFSQPEHSISSFELLRSGLVGTLYKFAGRESSALSSKVRHQLFMDAFMTQRDQSNTNAAAMLVRRLQETLSRLENVEIATTLSTGEESSLRNPMTNIGRQVRLKLISEDDEIPRSCTNIVVSIHAITSFQSLHDYLRPKIANAQSLTNSFGASAPESSSLSTMLAAFASSAGIEMPPGLRHNSDSAQHDKDTTREAQATSHLEKNNLANSKAPSQDDEGDTDTSKRRNELSSDEEQSHEKQSAPADEESDDNDELLARRLVEGLLQGEMGSLDDDEAFTDEYDEELVDEDSLSGRQGMGNQTFQVNLGNDEAPKLTPESSSKDAMLSDVANTGSSTPKPASTPTGSSSYASALQKKPADWHLEFEMDGKPISLKSTIYRAVHLHEAEGGNHSNSRYIWTNTYTVKYRKIAGPSPQEDQMPSSSTESQGPHKSFEQHKSWIQILQLLRVVYDLNREHLENAQVTPLSSHTVSEAAFVNNKLTAKLSRQLEEPLIVASDCLPSWAVEFPRLFPFLFPFESRYAFLQSTSFGNQRLINRWQTQHSRSQDNLSSRTDASLASLGRLTRQKVRISRNNVLASAVKVFDLYGTTSALLEVEYFDEVGTGLGPTLEFYAMCSKEFQKKCLALWRSDEAKDDGTYVYAPNGLFPKPIHESEKDSCDVVSRVRTFRVLGQFVAKALYDSRIVDLNFSSTFMRAVFEGDLPESLPTLYKVDSSLAQSLEKLRSLSKEEIESLSLDFTLPGQESYELIAGGAHQSVTASNLEEYIGLILKHSLVAGIRPCVDAFRQGFNLILPLSSMSTFTPEEMTLLFGNQEEDWSEATLLQSVKPDHGYNSDSITFRDVIAIMSQFTLSERRDFLQWLTGSPKLPIGGFIGLHPQLTIVKRTPDANLTADQTLPSVMTCVNFCKMPPFSSRETMKKRLLLAMQEGQASFHLS